MTTAAARLVNRLGGPYGEALAGQLVEHLPAPLTPRSGLRRVRRGGFHWDLDLADNLQRTLYLTGTYDDLTLRVVTGRLRPGDVVLDVGANIGSFALPVAARLRGGRVIAVEPAADTARTLRDHARRNHHEDTITVVEAALSSEPGSAVLRASGRGAADVGMRTLHGTGPVAGSDVRVTTVDLLREEVGCQRFDVVKVDVEGHELAVLDGMARTFAEQPPRILVMELSPSNQELVGASTDALVEVLSALGYRGRAIRHRGLGPITAQFCGNGLFERSVA
ncbi:MAG: FkbM family methyltransferase [Acidimicrobiales bacterium]